MAGFPINPPNTPLVDSAGAVTTEWWRFFYEIQRRLGIGDPFDDAMLLAGSQPDKEPGHAEASLDFTPGEVAAEQFWDFSAPSPLADPAYFPIPPVGAGTLTAGAGLNGGGSMEGNVTVNVATADAARIVVNADNIDLATTAVTPGTYAPPASITVDAYGRITAIS